MTHIMGYSIFFKSKKKKSFDIVRLWEKKSFKKYLCTREERFGLRMHAKNLNMN
jgi:hypothetical protein